MPASRRALLHAASEYLLAKSSRRQRCTYRSACNDMQYLGCYIILHLPSSELGPCLTLAENRTVLTYRNVHDLPVLCINLAVTPQVCIPNRMGSEHLWAAE